MPVSTKGRYALRVLIDMAEHQSENYVPLKEIVNIERRCQTVLAAPQKHPVQGII